MKVLPKELTIEQLLELSSRMAGYDLSIPVNFPPLLLVATIKVHKREAAKNLTAIVHELLGDEHFSRAIEGADNPAAKAIRADIALTELSVKEVVSKYAGSDDMNGFLKEVAPLSAKKQELEKKLDGLNDAEGIVMAKALELFGVEEAARGLEDGVSYKDTVLVWGQQKAATLEKFGVEELVLAPVDVLFAHKGLSVEGLSKTTDTGRIAVLKPLGDVWGLVTQLEPNGENSTFFKSVSALVGKDKTTDGVNQVRKYEGKLLPVVA